jgi:hypothetical protein
MLGRDIRILNAPFVVAVYDSICPGKPIDIVFGRDVVHDPPS